ncbi:MAG: tfuA protein [Alphaproteobacteria bacterium]|nr:tfuA protein [Alphaproteobacteria bacterium]
MTPKAIIFAGPSLPPACRPDDPALEWRPPVKQGDVYEAALARPAIIGIIDGYFEVTPTVWHKEILWAMAQGIHVYGSASIGALRAAELHTFGMVGVGRIFEAYRDGILTDDDEVAVLHGPEELGYSALTEAMVNIRATLDKALAVGVLEGAMVAQLIEIAKTLFYKGRSWAAILQLASRARFPIALDRLVAWLPTGQFDQKRVDAVEIIATIRAHLAAGVAPLVVSYRFSDTGYHHAAAFST